MSPQAGEKYFLRLPLCHIKGAKDLMDLLKVEVDGEEKTFETYKEACIAHGFLGDDRKWHQCLEEAMQPANLWPLRHILAVILEYN